MYRAGAHALSQGTISHAQGGSFWRGALSGALSSGIGSAIGAIGKAAAWSPGEIAAGQIIGGGLSGGIGSSLSGGKFWEGLGIGLTVGVFNHVLHEAEFNYKVDKELRTIGINGNDQAFVHCNSVELMLQLPTIKKLHSGQVAPQIYVIDEIHVVKYIKGKLIVANGKTTGQGIKLFKTAFSNYRTLASTIGHELNHWSHYFHYRQKWIDDGFSGPAMDIYSEYLAYKWENSYSGTPIPETYLNGSLQKKYEK